MKSEEKRIRIFKNEFLESFTHVPVWLPATIWLPLVFYLLFQSISSGSYSFYQLILIAGFGILFWTFAEYILHRFLFHAKFQNLKLQKMVFLLHGIHHDYPNDSERLLMPPLAAIPIAAIFWVLFNFILGPTLAKPFFAFFLVGYLFYDYIHYGTHHFKIRSSLMSALKKNHMAHHYVSSERYYGVSSPFWDIFFGTKD